MLSNCTDCDHYCNKQCAANPDYCDAFRKLRRYSLSDQETLKPIISPCQHWKESKELQQVDAEIFLSIRAWKRIARSKSPEFESLIQEARKITGYVPTEDEPEDTPF